MSSFISDIVKITEKQQKFVVNSRVDNTQSFANYLPSGRFDIAKNIDGSNLREMLSSLALEMIRKENSLKTIADQYYPYNTTDFLEEWESALLIPDDCFKIDGVSIEQRQKQIVAKLTIDNIINKDDFIALAAFFGYTITISTGFNASVFPMTFPFVLGGGAKATKFTMVVTFHGITPSTGFPYTFPFTFSGVDELGFLECLIKKLSPANVNVIFRK